MNKKYILYGTAYLSIATALNGIDEVNAFNNREFPLNKEIKTGFNNIRTAQDIVNIEDKNLLKAINKQLGRGEILDNVTVEDMESLTILNANNKGITSIKGIEKAINLTSLDLSENNIINVSYLSNLTSLNTLYLYDNQISDISGLSNLTKLTELYLGYPDKNGNFIKDISSLSNLVNLKKLNIEKNKISDISPLNDLTNLNHLNLYDNQISDISALNGLVNLNELFLEKNQITNISYISDLSNLIDLRLSSNLITFIPELHNLTNLKILTLNDNQITNISTLENLTSLTTLHLYTNQISDISSLENLTNLKILTLNDNQITNISTLENLTSLTTLHLYTNQISDISSLENLTSLTTLHLYNNQVKDISSLENLTSLTYLNLANNQIKDILSLENLTSLTYLQLANNQITDISDLSNLLKLNELYLDNNQISDISPVENLTGLSVLCLGYDSSKGNNIKDISPIENLFGLKKLYLQNNKIEDISILSNLTNLTYLELYNNRVSDISPIKNLKNLTALNLSNQKPIIESGDFKTKTDTLDVFINNPIIGVNNKVSNITNISNNGVYGNGKLKWNNLSLGSHSNTFNFSQEVKIGSATSTFSGTATINFNIIDGGAPESDHISDFDEDAFEIYTTVTATDLGEGVSHLIHKGVRHNLPYRFKYDIYDNSNNIVEIYDLVGNKEEYQVKLKDTDVPTIDTGINALKNKTDISSDDIKYFRTIVNDLDESSSKDLLQNKLNSVYTTDTLERKTATANVDIYIKSENMLSMSLNTNSIVFEDFSGVEDMEKSGAVEISINSSLPYKLNSYLVSEIQNADKSETIDKSLLNIKDSSSDEYKAFNNINEKLVLKDDCESGNDNIHNIDLRLSGGNSHVADIYKTVIKFEAEQK